MSKIIKVFKIFKIIISLCIIVIIFLTVISCKEAPEVVEEEEQHEEEKPAVEVPGETEEETKEEAPVVEMPEEEQEKEYSPKIVSTISVSGVAANVYVEGDYAYFVGNTYNIIDITDKENPRSISLHIPAMSWWRSGFFVEENFAYFPYETYDTEVKLSEGGFYIIDISNKDNPSFLGTFKSEGRIKDLWVVEDYAYATYETREKTQNKIAESGIKIIDVSDKENPVTLGIYETGNFSISSIRIEENYLYVIVEDNIEIIDIIDKVNPVGKGSYPIYYKGGFSTSGTLDFYVKGDYLYLPFDNSLKIIDVSDKENPVMVGEIIASGGVTDVSSDGSFAYIAYVTRNSEDQVEESGIQIIDVREKNNPTLVEKLEIPGEAEAMAIFVDGDYAYVGDWPGRCMHIIKLFNE